MLRVTMGPYLARRLRRMGSRSEKDLRSHRKLLMMGTEEGPGGSGRFALSLVLCWRRLRRNLRAAQRHRVTTRMNQVPIKVFLTE